MSGVVQDILDEREGSYGSFEDNARTAQALKETIDYSSGDLKKNPVLREAVDMILTKISRLCTGDPYHIDSWVDLAGYSRLGAKHSAQFRSESNEDE